jgi:hypothetical protein
MTKASRIKIVFGVLIFLSVVLVSLAIIIRPYLQIFFHDSNFQVFDHVLTAEQGNGVFISVRTVEMVYIGLMAISNLLWIVGGWYLLSTIKKKDDPAA